MLKEFDMENAINIILDCSLEMKNYESSKSKIQQYFSKNKVRNIQLRKSNLNPLFKAVICSKFENKNEISGLSLVLYKDGSGKKNITIQFRFLIYFLKLILTMKITLSISREALIKF